MQKQRDGGIQAIQPRVGFGRIFESLYKGSMVGAGVNVFALWPYVIANMRGSREHGALVELNPKLLGFVLGCEEAEIVKAIGYLCAPDKASRSKAEEGRRLVRVGQFAYRVVNGAEYLAIRMADDKRFAHAARQRRYEDRKRRGVTGRENRFVQAVADGDESRADEIAAEGLPEPEIAMPAGFQELPDELPEPVETVRNPPEAGGPEKC